jgi:hypothetical protein
MDRLRKVFQRCMFAIHVLLMSSLLHLRVIDEFILANVRMFVISTNVRKGMSTIISLSNYIVSVEKPLSPNTFVERTVVDRGQRMEKNQMRKWILMSQAPNLLVLYDILQRAPFQVKI